MLLRLLSTAALVASVAAPAAAVTTLTFNFGGGTGNAASVARTVDGVTLTATARRFTSAPNTLTSLTQTTGAGVQISASTSGIGVGGGGSNPQIDTNQAGRREAILIASSAPNFSLRGLKLSEIDANDTLQIYGVNADDTLTSLDFAGTIKSSLGGATVVNSAANGGTSAITLTTPSAYFSRYLFTTRVGGDARYMGDLGQGYRIDTVSGAVPEPGVWAMLIVGFGLVGFAARRRKRVVTA
ncbi:PEPxxWA-CTERM sorting domain-containing protein [Glacieibacterium frigidum]|uniref:PEP-CTERM sorting domain-containing protein n=1 Tax=Glacieibacterium frigidum TaxID=2593303 RepID=A0A552UGU4_9SPHN|nr:PEPxxWA-CTERM sorting domain-containing protein [Glacieibacterium frigidum]TRW17435.1 PEP-CTERM sorting domain-containing protein [Glacieibacterium frigidum]